MRGVTSSQIVYDCDAAKPNGFLLAVRWELAGALHFNESDRYEFMWGSCCYLVMDFPNEMYEHDLRLSCLIKAGFLAWLLGPKRGVPFFQAQSGRTRRFKVLYTQNVTYFYNRIYFCRGQMMSCTLYQIPKPAFRATYAGFLRLSLRSSTYPPSFRQWQSMVLYQNT